MCCVVKVFSKLNNLLVAKMFIEIFRFVKPYDLAGPIFCYLITFQKLHNSLYL